MVKELKDDKFLDRSILKACTDDKMNLAQKFKFFFFLEGRQTLI